MAHTLQAKLKETGADENKRGPRPQDLIRLYDIILQVGVGNCPSAGGVPRFDNLMSSCCLSGRVWLSSPPCRDSRMTTPSRRRCPSRRWSTRPTGLFFFICFYSNRRDSKMIVYSRRWQPKLLKEPYWTIKNVWRCKNVKVLYKTHMATKALSVLVHCNIRTMWAEIYKHS